MAAIQAMCASTNGMAALGCNAAAISMEKLHLTTAAVRSRFQATAASSPLAHTATTAMATVQAMCASTNGMAALGCNAAAILMEKLHETSSAVRSRFQATAASSPWALIGTMAMAAIQAMCASTHGMAALGCNVATILMEKLQMMRAAIRSHFQATAAWSPLAHTATTAMATVQATHAFTNGMAALGFNAAAILMEKLQETRAAGLFRYLLTAASLPLAPGSTTAMATNQAMYGFLMYQFPPLPSALMSPL
ncbi:hypothetical protein Syncc8109_1805 [Synechococcus sp. WH 8109]|nr:hypothetical protein Syncc8109_1805 [Synechococcus sp. WH 8109]